MAENFYDQYRKANQFAMLGNIGRGLLGAYASGMPTGQGLAYGLSQGQSQMDPLQMLRLREELAEKEAQKARAGRASELFGGYDPQTGIDWRTGRPESQALLGSQPEGVTAMLGALPPTERIATGIDLATRENDRYQDVSDPTEVGLPKGTIAQRGPKGKLNVVYNPKDPERDTRTALQKDVPYIAEILGISEPEAAQLKLTSRTKGYDATLADAAARLLPYSGSPEEAYNQGKQFADLVFGRTPKAKPGTPKAEEQKGVFGRLWGYVMGDEAGAGSVTPEGEAPPESPPVPGRKPAPPESAAAPAEPPPGVATATNPETGEKVWWDEDSQQWLPFR